MDARILVYMIIAIGAMIAAFLEAKKRSKKFRDGLDKLALKLPIFGDLVYKQLLHVIAGRLRPIRSWCSAH